jgi:predicted RNA-binding protein with RPS1 domain
MKYLIIDDKPFAEALCKHLLKNVEVAEIDKSCNDKALVFSNGKESVAIDFSKHTAREISDAIIKTYNPVKNQTIILFINVNLKVGKDSRQLQKGIELLIWLRIKGVMNHCVLYSFEDLHTILNREPKHLIATSKGTTFVQLPSDFSRINLEKINGVKADIGNIKKTLKAAFDIAKFRHSYANMWGLKRLLEVHKFFVTSFDERIIKYDTEITSSLEYNIAEYIFSEHSNLNLNYNYKNTIGQALTNLQELLHNHRSIEILFIDDKAETGWRLLLESILGRMIKTLTIKDINTDDLISQFEALNKSNKIDIIISDLRLYPEEEKLTDYNDFKSIKLLKYIFDKQINRRLVYINLRYVLFTASNQLLNYKNLVKSNKYVPSGIFIKEGFDFYINDNQQEQNYLNLINALSPAIAENYNKKGAKVETSNLDEQDRIDKIKSQEKSEDWKRQTDSVIEAFKNFDYVFLDANIFMSESHMYIALSGSEKIRCIYPVYKELERIASTREATYRVWIADRMKVTFKNDIFKEGFTEAKIQEIDKKFADGKYLKDYADRFFLPIIQAIHKSDDTKKVLFITNDTKEDSPYRLVREWINSNNINLIKVKSATEFIQTIGINKQIPKLGENFSGKVMYFLSDKDTPSIKYAALIELNSSTKGFLHRNNAKALNNNQEITNIKSVIRRGQSVQVQIINVDLSDIKDPRITLKALPNTP